MAFVRHSKTVLVVVSLALLVACKSPVRDGEQYTYVPKAIDEVNATVTGFAESGSDKDGDANHRKSITVVLDGINHQYVVGAGRELQYRVIPSEYKMPAGATNLWLHAYLTRVTASGKTLTNEKDFGLSFEAKMGHHYQIHVSSDVPDPEQYGVWVFDELRNVVGGVSLRLADK